MSGAIEIPFTKMAGTGNDFIVIDNRANILGGDVGSFAKRVCRRRVSVGADGVLLLEESEDLDFKMRYFNADGGEAEFCGNGARCIALYAYVNGIGGKEMAFDSGAGVTRARVTEKGVSIEMPESSDMRLHLSLAEGMPPAHSITVGVPHVVFFVDRVDEVDVVGEGRAVREMDQFRPAGTNVNFVQMLTSARLKVRTYERGVEDETYSCGTGVCASALIAHRVHGIHPPVSVTTTQGEILTVSFRHHGNQIAGCTLTGEARRVYCGTVTLE